jgi:hypothetical protein
MRSSILSLYDIPSSSCTLCHEDEGTLKQEKSCISKLRFDTFTIELSVTSIVSGCFSYKEGL